MKRLDISHNADLDGQGFEYLAEMIHACDLKQIVLCGCQVDQTKIGKFEKRLQELKPKIDELDVSYNKDLRRGGMSSLSRIKCCNEVSNLNIAGCKLTCKDIIEFEQAITHPFKMEVLNLSDNPCLASGITNVAHLAVRCSVQELYICECSLNRSHIRLFVNVVGDHKFKILDVSEPDWIPNQEYISAAVWLISCVQDKLIMIFSDIEKKLCDQLCKERDKINQNLEILFDDS